MAVQYLALGGWVFVLAVLSAIRMDLVAILALIVVSSYVMWFFVDPRRSWWGAGPRSVLADPTALRRYQVRMTVAMVVAILVAIPAANLILLPT